MATRNKRDEVAGEDSPSVAALSRPGRYLVKDYHLSFVENFLPGSEPEMRPVLERVAQRGADPTDVIDIVQFVWRLAIRELLRKGLVNRAIPGTKEADATLADFDRAARRLLKLTQLPKGHMSRPVLAAKMDPKVRELLGLVGQLQDKTASLLKKVVADEVRKERVRLRDHPQGRPERWDEPAHELFKAAGVSDRSRDEIRGIVARRVGLKAR